jgi:hypothetical protein
LGVGRRWGNRCLWLLGGAHARFLTCCEAATRPIRALREGAGTGMPTILLGSKTSRRRLERTGVSPKTTPAPKSLSGLLWRALVEMLPLASGPSCIHPGEGRQPLPPHDAAVPATRRRASLLRAEVNAGASSFKGRHPAALKGLGMDQGLCLRTH